MKIDYIKENYKFEALTTEHDLSEFNSDSEDLNDFLKKDALEQQNRKLNLTKLITCDEKIIGYVSLLTDLIPLKDIRDDKVLEDIKKQLSLTSKKKGIPAIKIGRLAIDKRYSGQGLGSDILMSILLTLKILLKQVSV